MTLYSFTYVDVDLKSVSLYKFLGFWLGIELSLINSYNIKRYFYNLIHNFITQAKLGGELLINYCYTDKRK